MWPKLQIPADLVTLTEEIRNEKLHFLCSVDCTQEGKLIQRQKIMLSQRFFIKSTLGEKGGGSKGKKLCTSEPRFQQLSWYVCNLPTLDRRYLAVGHTTSGGQREQSLS